MATTTVTASFSAVGTSGSLPVPQNALHTLLITGTFVATLLVERSQDGGLNWIPLNSYTAALAAKNFVSPLGIASLYRVRCSSYTSGIAAITMTLPDPVLFEVDNAGGTPVLKALASGVQSPNLVGTPTGLAAYDPGQIAVNTLRVASDVVSAETVTIGADVYEVEIVNTDSTDVTAGGDFNNTAAVISIMAATYPHLSTTLGTLIRVENEIMRLTATGTYLTYARGVSGTTIAAHADAVAIYKGDGIAGGSTIAVGLVTTLTPTAFTAALLAAINAVGTELVTAVLISVNEILLQARSVGAVVLATTETLAGANNAWAATAMYGGKAQGVRKFNFQSRVPKALDVTLGTMKFQFNFTPTLVQVYIVVTATPGVALAWDGGVTIAGGLVTIDNTGSTDWAVTNTVYVYAQG